MPISKPSLEAYASPDVSVCSADLGYAAVSFGISSAGAPEDLKVTQRSSDAVAQTVLKAVEAWRFDPATKGGETIPGNGNVLLECGGTDVVATEAGGGNRVGGGVSPPSQLFRIEPEYSEEARKAKYQGTATLSLVVDPAGRPAMIRVIRSLGLGLDEKAVEAVSQWRFKPGMKDGKPVPVMATIQVNFRLL